MKAGYCSCFKLRYGVGNTYLCCMAENEKEAFTPLSALGEFGLIERLTANFPLQQASTILGVGDDAAILENLDKQTVVSSDMLVEGVHFDLTYMPPQHLGYKAVVVNLSDVVAMNARPTQILVNLAISNRFGLEYLEKIYEGIRAACNHYEIDLIGGDTTSSFSGLMISITAFGEAQAADVVTRSGGRPTDLLVVSGDLGGAYLGLQILKREKEVFKTAGTQPKLDPYTYAVQRQLKPEARYDLIPVLSNLELRPTAMIDISDGLSSEVMHLCRQSHTGARIHEEKIPLDPSIYRICEELNLNTTTVALNGGEDYELLMAIPVQEHEKIKANPDLSVIGYLTEPEQGMALMTRDGQAIELQAQGWNALA